MEAQLKEERRKREEIESRLEQERKLREEQELRWQQEREAEWQLMQTMFAYIQGLGASVNYQPPPTVSWPPPPLPQMDYPSVFPPPSATGTPVSMNVFTCLRIHIDFEM